MKNLRLLVLASFALTTAGTLFVTACSDDGDLVVSDAGSPETGGSDTGSPLKVDSGEDPKDTGTDTNLPDVDAGNIVDIFTQKVSAGICESVARCCFGNPNPPAGSVDGGSFNKAKCDGIYKGLGFENSSYNIAKSNVTLNQAVSDQCLAKIKAMTCNLPATELQDIRTQCFNAFVGTLAAGQACKASFECAPGNFCLINGNDAGTDGGAGGLPKGSQGTCQPLRAQGQICDIISSGDPDTDAIDGEEACSYRGSGTPKLRCDTFDFDGGVQWERKDWKCQPQVANGDNCYSTVWCSAGICDQVVCKTPVQYFKDICSGLVTP